MLRDTNFQLGLLTEPAAPTPAEANVAPSAGPRTVLAGNVEHQAPARNTRLVELRLWTGGKTCTDVRSCSASLA
jgi:hypothetical protein